MKDNDTSQINPEKLKCLALKNRHLQHIYIKFNQENKNQEEISFANEDCY
jgi:hypothetical protein